MDGSDIFYHNGTSRKFLKKWFSRKKQKRICMISLIVQFIVVRSDDMHARQTYKIK